MFVRNKSTSVAHLSSDTLPVGVSVAAVIVECVYSIVPGHSGLATLIRDYDSERQQPEDRPRTAPPFPGRTTLWKGVSATVAGHVEGSAESKTMRVVSLRLGDALHRELVVFGRRFWRALPEGGYQITAPEPLEALPMSWEAAYGGRIDLLPGYYPGTELPYPGGSVAFELNPEGKGFCLDPALGEGVELPQIESRAELLKSPAERPRPACLAPCPKLMVMRRGYRAGEPFAEEKRAAARTLVETLEDSVWLAHHAAGENVLAGVEPGALMQLDGMRAGQLAVALPAPPVEVIFRYEGGKREEARGRIRSVHLDADLGQLRIVYGYLHRVKGVVSPRVAQVTEAPPP